MTHMTAYCLYRDTYDAGISPGSANQGTCISRRRRKTPKRYSNAIRRQTDREGIACTFLHVLNAVTLAEAIPITSLRFLLFLDMPLPIMISMMWRRDQSCDCCLVVHTLLLCKLSGRSDATHRPHTSRASACYSKNADFVLLRVSGFVPLLQ